ncbi:hypothetical protein [Amycolatopsis sp. NPDC059021]|uniref:hypothetical protein n=1 Tax=Amycolatopsis sp. NPDC059021 TaxID=3346704 RepID=UPI00366B5D84
MVRNATIGRRLARLAETAGFAVRPVLPVASVLRDFPAASMLFLMSLESRYSGEASPVP